VRRMRAGFGVLAAGVLAACDIPTALPRVESRFVVPGEEVVLGIEQFLPAGVAVAGGSFRLTLDPQPVPRRTLGELCGAPCLPLQGQRVPKPAFTATIQASVPFPAELVSATLVSGSVAVTLTHDFGFDPLHPEGRSEDGRITVTVRSGGRTVAGGALTGPFPSGTARALTLPLAPGEVADTLEVSLVLVSPAGGSDPAHWVTVDNTAALSGSVAPGPLEVSELRLALDGRSVSADATVLDLSGIDAAISDRVRRGAIVLDVANPFALSATLTLRLATPAGTLAREVRLAPGETRQRLEFTGEELRMLLGQRVAVSLEGTVEAPAPVAVRPGQEVRIGTTLDLVVELGPEG
jgi:hypothetical protein